MAEVAARGKASSERPGTYLTTLGAWAFAMGTAIGWGSLVVTANTYLVKGGPLGSSLGMLVGMAIMMVVARNYHYMMCRHSDPGGVYAYARDIFGFDHGVLTAWFLGLTYIAVFWANATSVPLFMRYFVGDVFQFGLRYQIFGYTVYLGEALLSIGAIALAALFCTHRRQEIQVVMIGLVVVFVVGIGVCFAAAARGHGATSFDLQPLFVPDGGAFAQVMRIAMISPWAFIGFENISHLSEEFAFPRTRTFKILLVSLVSVTAVYICIMLLSTMAYPESYDSWYGYLLDLDSNPGLDGLPSFFAARFYLGQLGVILLMLSLLALVITSLIANIVALSRLVYALARDEVLPYGLATLSDRGVPAQAVRAIALVSLVIPFLGRTAVGWIVDVTTLGATIVYGFVSACAYREARHDGDRVEAVTGALGIAIMVVFCVMLLLPSITGMANMATESYFLFTVWGVVGFLVFRRLLRRDDDRRFGKSIVAWLVLLSLILFTSFAWFGEIATESTDRAMSRVQGYYSGTGAPEDLALSEDAFVERINAWLNRSMTQGMIVVGCLFMLSLSVMLSNFSIMRRREEESERKLAGVRSIANRDPLTGVKNKLAFSSLEEELDARIGEGTVESFAVVVCDVNGLKQVNDTLGHKAGDAYIRAASALICDLFKHSPVFRIGGDEFVVVLRGDDYEHRQSLMTSLDRRTMEHVASGEVVVAAGMAEYDAGRDSSAETVFDRADELMYARKKELKTLQALPER